MQAVENGTVNYRLSGAYQGKLGLTTDWRKNKTKQALLEHR